MKKISIPLTQTFKNFLASEQAGSVLLVLCTIASLIIANTALGPAYLHFWHGKVGPLSVELWVNDLLMAIFFLLIGLELKRELYVGELSDLKTAMLPIFAAIGGMFVPAGIHFALNNGTPEQAGLGIPMATDIAFALGAISLLGTRVPASLKVFLVALAVIDDLGAIIVIAVFYTTGLSWTYLALALATVGFLAILNKLRVMTLIPYLAFGLLAWYFMFKSGVHATIAGVLVAFTIPFTAKADDEESPSHILEHVLHRPVAFLILPIFALANTGIVIQPGWTAGLLDANSLGIMLGLVVGKPVGITLTSLAAVASGLCRLPLDLNWKHVFGAGVMAAIGFTMAIFITNLAFAGDTYHITESKMSILIASVFAAVSGYIFLRIFGGRNPDDVDPDTMELEVVNGEA